MGEIVGRLHGRCDDAMRAVSDRFERPLPWARRMMLLFHLSTCAACDRASRQLEAMHEAAGSEGTRMVEKPLEGEKLGEAARERIAQRIAEERI